MNYIIPSLQTTFRTAINRTAIMLLYTFTLVTGNVAAAPIMYVHDSSGVLGTVDVATGTVSVIGNMGVVVTDIAFYPSENLFSFTYLYSINKIIAAVSLIGAHGINGGNALVFGTDGTLYGAGFSTTSLFKIDPLTGSSTNLGNIGFASDGDLAFNGGDHSWHLGAMGWFASI